MNQKADKTAQIVNEFGEPVSITGVPLPEWVAQPVSLNEPVIDTREVASLAADVGLLVTGVSPAGAFRGLEGFLSNLIADGVMDGLDWFDVERARIASDPKHLHRSVRSLISVGVPYYMSDIQPPQDDVPRGRIARYAWGRDYHRILKRRMRDLHRVLEARVGQEIEARHLVDTARIVDRAVAARAGSGWYGKNGCILVPGFGSWVMLGDLLVDIDVEPTRPLHNDCGRCTICVGRCPTGAISPAYTVQTPKCISFQTIEQRGSIPVALREHMGKWVFGCDVCQEVCPYTDAVIPLVEEEFRPSTVEHAFPSLPWLLSMSEEAFVERYKGTAVMRAKRRGLARNAAIAVGNSGDRNQIPLLGRVVNEHDEPLVRSHAAWGLGKLGGGSAIRELERCLTGEPDRLVREEVKLALEVA